MKKVSSTKLSLYLGRVEADWRALSKCAMYRFATIGLTGDSIAVPLTSSCYVR